MTFAYLDGASYAAELNRKRALNAAEPDQDENGGNVEKIAFGAAGGYDTVSLFSSFIFSRLVHDIKYLILTI